MVREAFAMDASSGAGRPGLGPDRQDRPTVRAAPARASGDGAFFGAQPSSAPIPAHLGHPAPLSPLGGERGAAAVAQASGCRKPSRGAMRYQAFQAAADLLAPARLAAGWANGALALGPPWLRDLPPLSQYSAAWEMLTRAGLTHHRPGYGID